MGERNTHWCYRDKWLELLPEPPHHTSFVRHVEIVLLLQRSAQIKDFAGSPVQKTPNLHKTQKNLRLDTTNLPHLVLAQHIPTHIQPDDDDQANDHFCDQAHLSQPIALTPTQPQPEAFCCYRHDQ